MIIHLIAVGNKMPDWVRAGYQEYAKRMPQECMVRLIEIPPSHRSKSSDLKRAISEEGARMLASIPKGGIIVAMDVKGKPISTEQLADNLASWLQSGRDLAILIGGPEGLSVECKQRADHSWSLSNMTFPHPFVRVILAEQLYRAWSILNNHPYHRG